MAGVRASEKGLLVVSIVVFSVLIVAVGVLGYLKLREIKALEKETRDEQVKAKELKKKVDMLPAKEQERAALAAETADYEKMLPGAKEVENLMEVLSEQAGLSDCRIKDFALVTERKTAAAKAAAPTTYEKVSFECSVSSAKARKGYFSASKFLNLLERYERFIAADKFILNAGKSEGLAMTLDLTAHTYIFTGKMQVAGQPAGGQGAKEQPKEKK